MAVRAVLVVPGNPVLTAQPPDQLVVAFKILSAVFTFRAGADMKDKSIGLNAMALEHLGNDLRHRQLLENPLVVAELQVVQCGHQGQLIAGQASAGFADQNIFDMPVNPFTLQAKAQERRLTEQAFQIEIRVLADQLDADRIQATNGFSTAESQHFEVVANRGDL
ncbi:hypothetical protein D3C84_626780 [compost metagenome]